MYDMSKRQQTTYKDFKEYQKEDINKIISNLPEDEKIIFLRYGIDLNNSVTSHEWNNEISKKNYNCIISKIKRVPLK